MTLIRMTFRRMTLNRMTVIRMTLRRITFHWAEWRLAKWSVVAYLKSCCYNIQLSYWMSFCLLSSCWLSWGPLIRLFPVYSSHFRACSNKYLSNIKVSIVTKLEQWLNIYRVFILFEKWLLKKRFGEHIVTIRSSLILNIIFNYTHITTIYNRGVNKVI